MVEIQTVPVAILAVARTQISFYFPAMRLLWKSHKSFKINVIQAFSPFPGGLLLLDLPRSAHADIKVGEPEILRKLVRRSRPVSGVEEGSAFEQGVPAPFLDVAMHVVQPEAIRLEAADRR